MIGQAPLLSEMNHKANQVLRLLRYAWIYMCVDLCFQCWRSFDWHLVSWIINEAFTEAGSNGDREMCLSLWRLFSAQGESRTGQDSLSGRQ